MLLQELMNDFFFENPDSLPGFLPLATKESDERRFDEWEEVDSPRRLVKDYAFNDRNMAFRFVTGLMRFEDAVGHNAKIIIDYTNVRTEVYTHDVNDITELDMEYAQYADSLFIDVRSP